MAPWQPRCCHAVDDERSGGQCRTIRRNSAQAMAGRFAAHHGLVARQISTTSPSWMPRSPGSRQRSRSASALSSRPSSCFVAVTARSKPVAGCPFMSSSAEREVCVLARWKPGLGPETRRTGGGPAVPASPPPVGSSAQSDPAAVRSRPPSRTHGDRGAAQCAAWFRRRPTHAGGRSRAPA